MHFTLRSANSTCLPHQVQGLVAKFYAAKQGMIPTDPTAVNLVFKDVRIPAAITEPPESHCVAELFIQPSFDRDGATGQGSRRRRGLERRWRCTLDSRVLPSTHGLRIPPTPGLVERLAPRHLYLNMSHVFFSRCSVFGPRIWS